MYFSFAHIGHVDVMCSSVSSICFIIIIIIIIIIITLFTQSIFQKLIVSHLIKNVMSCIKSTFFLSCSLVTIRTDIIQIHTRGHVRSILMLSLQVASSSHVSQLMCVTYFSGPIPICNLHHLYSAIPSALT